MHKFFLIKVILEKEVKRHFLSAPNREAAVDCLLVHYPEYRHALSLAVFPASANEWREAKEG